MMTVTTALFSPDESHRVPERSRVYSPEWVDKLARGVRRFSDEGVRFVCLTHYAQDEFKEDVEAVPFLEDTREVMCLTEVFRPDLGIDRGMFIALDSIILGNLSDLFSYRGDFALPRLEFHGKSMFYNPVCLYHGPAATVLWENRDAAKASKYHWDDFGPSEQLYWAGEYPGKIDDIHELYRGQIASYSWLIPDDRPPRRKGRGDSPYGTEEELAQSVRVAYFYGALKPHNASKNWVTDQWK